MRAQPGRHGRDATRRRAPRLEALERRDLLAAGSIQFSATALTVADTVGTVPIVLTRAGGSTGAVSVALVTGDGTAISGTDYNSLSGSISFPDGVTTEKVNLTIFPDPVANLPGRTVNLTLSSPSGGATLGAASSAVLTITHAAKAGDLDGTFGKNGEVDVQPGTTALPAVPGPPVLFGSDGSAYVVSVENITTPVIHVNKARPDGTPDTSYGAGGLASVAVSQPPQLTGATIQPDGKILVAGQMGILDSSGSDFVLARFNTNGTPDPTFGQGGVATLAVPAQFAGATEGVTVLAGGQIVVAYTHGDFSTAGLSLVAFDSSGRPSLSFGSGGIATAPVGLPSGGSYLVLAMPDGTIVVGGSVGSGGAQQPALWRFKPDGSMDTPFGNGGLALGPVGYFGYFQCGLAPNGDIVQIGQGGAASAGGIGGGTILFYRDNGTLDPAFNGSGEFDPAMTPQAFAFQPNGQLVLIGQGSQNGGPNRTVLARLNPGGSLDTSFGQNGYAYPGGTETPNALASVGGDKILEGATTYDPVDNTDNGLSVLKRYIAPSTIPNPSIAVVVGSDGQVYTRALDAFGRPTGAYVLTGYGQVLGLAATRLASANGVETFVIGGDNQVYAQTVSASGVGSGYVATAYGAISSVSVGTDTAGNPLMFAIGTDHQLYEQKFNASGAATSGSYTRAAFGDFKLTVLTHDASGNPLLYAVGQDNQVYGLKMTADGTPSGPLFKMASGGVNQLAVGATASGAPELFVVGLDNYVYALKADATGSPSGGYFGGIGGPVQSITVGADTSHDPLLFAVGSDNKMYGHTFSATGTPTGSFYGTSPLKVGAIAAGVGANGSPTVFGVLSADGQVYTAPFDPTGKSTTGFAFTTAGAVKKVVLV